VVRVFVPTVLTGSGGGAGLQSQENEMRESGKAGQRAKREKRGKKAYLPYAYPYANICDGIFSST